VFKVTAVIVNTQHNNEGADEMSGDKSELPFQNNGTSLLSLIAAST
jgi:hypothetical protein